MTGTIEEPSTRPADVPMARPWFGPDEVQAVSEVVASGWVSQGARVVEFESAIATAVDARHTVAVSNCTTALHLGMVVAGLIPWPDPRHRLVNLGLGILLAPPCLIWGLWRVRGTERLRWFLAAVFVAMAILTVLTRHLLFKGLVNDANVGWWERAFALVLIGWTGVAAWALERRLTGLSRSA